MKVSELQGAELDYWVAKADGIKDADIIDHIAIMDDAPPSWCRLPSGISYAPSTRWVDGGPIIDTQIKMIHTDGGKVRAVAHDGSIGWGATFQEAACRAYVASKFGDTVPTLAGKTASSAE